MGSLCWCWNLPSMCDAVFVISINAICELNSLLFIIHCQTQKIYVFHSFFFVFFECLFSRITHGTHTLSFFCLFFTPNIIYDNRKFRYFHFPKKKIAKLRKRKKQISQKKQPNNKPTKKKLLFFFFNIICCINKTQNFWGHKVLLNPSMLSQC